jgi:hypothetical protein
MIDRSSRTALSESARALAAGLVTNSEFEKRIPRSSDPAIEQIYEKGLWPLYDDIREHRCIGKDRLEPASREFVARCVLFLSTDLPDRWQVRTELQELARNLLKAVTLGRSGRDPIRECGGDLDVWPFWSVAEVEAAKRNPRFLAGHDNQLPRVEA